MWLAGWWANEELLCKPYILPPSWFTYTKSPKWQSQLQRYHPRKCNAKKLKSENAKCWACWRWPTLWRLHQNGLHAVRKDFCAGRVGLSKDSSMPCLKSRKTQLRVPTSVNHKYPWPIDQQSTSPCMLSVNRPSGSWTNVPCIALAGCLHVIRFSLLLKSPTSIWSTRPRFLEGTTLFTQSQRSNEAVTALPSSWPMWSGGPVSRSRSAPRCYNFLASMLLWRFIKLRNTQHNSQALSRELCWVFLISTKCHCFGRSCMGHCALHQGSIKTGQKNPKA